MANEGKYLFNLTAPNMVAQAAKAAKGEALIAVQDFVKTFSRAIRRDRHTRIKGLFQEAAIEAQGAVVRAYENRPNQRGLGAYRNDDNYIGPSGKSSRRYGGGLLLAALNSPQMYQVTETGVKFINKEHLTTAAAQWKRLNFGAGSRGGQTPPGKHYKMKIFGQTLPGDFGLFDIGKEPGFKLPPGWWSSTFPGATREKWDDGRRGQDHFIRAGYMSPGRGQIRLRPTASLGIQGSRFLDVGVGRLVQTFPIAMETLVSEWFKEAQVGKGPIIKYSVSNTVDINNRARQIEQIILARGRTASFINR